MKRHDCLLPQISTPVFIVPLTSLWKRPFEAFLHGLKHSELIVCLREHRRLHTGNRLLLVLAWMLELPLSNVTVSDIQHIPCSVKPSKYCNTVLGNGVFL